MKIEETKKTRVRADSIPLNEAFRTRSDGPLYLRIGSGGLRLVYGLDEVPSDGKILSPRGESHLLVLNLSTGRTDGIPGHAEVIPVKAKVVVE